jgi:hypothetical protein
LQDTSGRNPYVAAVPLLWLGAAVSCVLIHDHLDVERLLYALAVTYTVCLVVYVIGRRIEAALRDYIDYRLAYMLNHLAERDDRGMRELAQLLEDAHEDVRKDR